jgi:nucleoside-triphosphatase THEP1
MRTMVIVTGERNGGKTSELKGLIEEKRLEGLSIGGFFTEAMETNGEKTAYYLRRVEAEERLLLAERRNAGRRAGASDETAIQADGGTPKFRFYEEVFERAASWLEEDAAAGKNMICIDELGPVELRGEGHWPALNRLLDFYRGELAVVIRRGLLDSFLSRFKGRGWLCRLRPAAYRNGN